MSDRSSRMATVLVLAAVLQLAACAANGKAPDRCKILQSPTQSAKVLEAIDQGGIRWLMACGLKADQALVVDGQPLTPLQFAASRGKPALVRQVVQAGADPNHGGDASLPIPPLEVALSSQKYESARALLDLGARADYAMQGTRTTALMTLAFDKTTGQAAAAMSRLLVAKGAAPNAKDAKGNTSLHWSARSNHADLTAALLELGADACAVNDKAQKPVDVAPQDAASLRASLAAACKVVRP